MAFLRAAEVNLTLLSDTEDSDSDSEVEFDLTDSTALLQHKQTSSSPGAGTSAQQSPVVPFKDAKQPVKNGHIISLKRVSSQDEGGTAPLLSDNEESESLKAKQKSELFRCLAIALVCLFQGVAFPIQCPDALLLNVEGSDLQKVVIISIYTTFILACVGAPALVKLLSLKWILCLGCTGSFFYLVVRLSPDPALVVAGALFAGLTQGAMLGAAGTLVTHHGTQFSIFGGHSLSDTVALFNGLFYTWFLGAPLIYGILRLTILPPDASEHSSRLTNVTTEIPESDSRQCGVHYCWNDQDDQDQLSSWNDTLAGHEHGDVNSHRMQALLGTLIVCALGAWLMAVLTVDRKTRNVTASSFRIRKEEGCWQFMKSLQLLEVITQWKDVTAGLLLVLMLYVGVQQMVGYHVILTAFVECESSARDALWVMVCMSLGSLLTALPTGALSKYAGRVKFTVAAMVVEIAVYATILAWHQPPVALYFGLMTVWGMADAALQVQMAAMLGVLFPESLECSYAGMRLWQMIGYIIVYTMCIYLCSVVVLSVSLMLLLLAGSLYISLEIVTRLQERERKSNSVKKQHYVLPEFAAWIPQFNPHQRGATMDLCTKQGSDGEDLIST